MPNDREIMERFVAERSEAAFAELISRHIDLVYSTALRMVGGDMHLAEDISQTVFVELARKAPTLPESTLIPVWLYRRTKYASANVVRTERRRKQREKDAMELQNQNSSEHRLWEQIAPHLDEAMDQLNTTDRHCILLRFLKQHDLRTVGKELGISEDAAQKRTSRAVQRLRQILLRQGVSASGTLLSTTLTLKCVTTAPSGLAASILTSSLSVVPLVGIPLNTINILAAMKTKICIMGAITLVSIIPPWIIHHRAYGNIREQNEIMRNQRNQLALRSTSNNPSSIQHSESNGIPPSESPKFRELMKLRGQVGVLRTQLANLKQKSEIETRQNARQDRLRSIKTRYANRVKQLKELFEASSSEKIPELSILNEEDWLFLVAKPVPNSPQGILQALSKARTMAESEFGNRILKPALKAYLHKNQNQFPHSISDLRPFFNETVDSDIMERWTVMPVTQLVEPLRNDLKPDSWVIAVKRPVNRNLDQRYLLGATKVALFADAPAYFWDTPAGNERK